MISDLKPYPKMKNSGVEWLGEVPEHWELRRTKAVLEERVEKGFPNETLLAATQSKGVVSKQAYENRTVVALKDLHLLKLVRAGDFVISLRSFEGGIEIAHEQGIISPAYTILSPRDARNRRYLAYLFKSRRYVENLGLFVTGIREGQNISYERLSRSLLPIPPPADQAAIVRFLDYFDRSVRRPIRANRRLVALLTEQRKAIVYNAVSGGVDPDVHLTETGLPWCPLAPSHWDLRPNRTFLRQRRAIVGERHSDYTLLSLTKRGVVARDLTDNVGKFSSDMGTSQEVRSGDIVMCLFDVPETPRTVGLSEHAGMITGAYTVFEVSDHELARWFEAFYQAMDDRKLLSPLYSGLRNTIPKARLLGTKTPIPPRHELQRILAAIEESLIATDTAIAHANSRASLLTELRERLIADVVTGKVDVREAVVQLEADASLWHGEADHMIREAASEH